MVIGKKAYGSLILGLSIHTEYKQGVNGSTASADMLLHSSCVCDMCVCVR